MDFTTILFWFVCLSCLPALFRAAIHFKAIGRGWIVVYLAVLLVTLAGGWQKSDSAVYAGGALWALLVLVPALLSRIYLRSFLQQRFSLARRAALVLRALHPMDGWREQPEIAHALELAHQDKLSDAIEILRRHENGKGPAAQAAMAHLYRLTNQWDQYLAWRETQLPGLRASPAFLQLTLRAMGECGYVEGLIQTYERHQKAIARLEPPVQRNLCRLMLLAFCGERDSVERLLEGSLTVLPEPLQRFWLATADLAAGVSEDAQNELRGLLPEADPVHRRAIEYRLARPPADTARRLAGHARELVAGVKKELDQEERFGARPRFFSRLARGTQAILALNLVAFLLEVRRGGSTNFAVLFELGGLVPTVVREGQWWRTGAAIFLHYGSLHLTMNMLGLWALGPFVETALGFRRFLLVYFVAGIGSMTTVAVLATGTSAETLTVGASGCVMGLVGATGAIMLHGWRRERAPAAWRRFVAVLVIVMLQMTFDWVVPQVSMTAHLSGALIGFVVALLNENRISGVQSAAADAE